MLQRLINNIRVCVLAVAALLPSAPAAGAAGVPGFQLSDALVNVAGTTSMAFSADGRQLLVAAKQGTLTLIDVDAGANLAARTTLALNLSARVCTQSERGLLGLALDPAYLTTGWVYLFYTFDRGITGPNRCRQITSGQAADSASPVNRVSRFTMQGDGTIDPGSERVLVDNMPSPAGNHNAGDIQIGRDGLLYIAIGDGGCDYGGGGCGGSNNAARDANVLTGKILRIIPDPDLPAEQRIPSTNPFRSAGTVCAVEGRGPDGTPISTPCQETFATGLRNPFRMAFDPNASGAETRFLINDVGQGIWEEIDIGEAGADYRWNFCEGSHVNGTRTACAAPAGAERNPIHEYDHAGDDGGADTSGCHSITDGALVPNNAWPPAYSGDYLFADYVCGRLFRIDLSGSAPYQRTLFADGLGALVDLTFGPGPHGPALYLANIGDGSIRRITAQPLPSYTIYLPVAIAS